MTRKKKTPEPARRNGPPYAFIVLGLALLVGAAYFALTGSQSESGAPAANESATASSAAPAARPVQPIPPSTAIPAATPRPASRLGSDLPPLPAGPMARPREVVEAVYEFAARHPEVLSHVPCFCGCERNGHIGNDDCFVASRSPDGQVTWTPHGMT